MHGTYEALLDDPDVDAVYIPLPNGLHGAWTVGRSRPASTCCARSRSPPTPTRPPRSRQPPSGTACVVMEAFHWRYHPLRQRLVEIVGSGELGEIRRSRRGVLPAAEASRHPLEPGAGGRVADGRRLLRGAPAPDRRRCGAGRRAGRRVRPAKFTGGGVDRALAGKLRWGGGLEASLRCGFANGAHPVDLHLRVVGSKGEVLARNPIAPHLGGHLVVRQGGRRTYEWADRTPSYTYQLRAFVDAVRDGTPFPTTAADAVRNMAVIDAAPDGRRRDAAEADPGADESAWSDGVSRLAEIDLAFADDAPLRLVLHAEIAATPDDVYAALSDDPATWTWFPSLQGGRFPGDSHGVGDPREVRIGGTTIAETILAADPGQRWAYRVDAMQIPIAKALVEVWDLAEVPATSTRPAATRDHLHVRTRAKPAERPHRRSHGCRDRNPVREGRPQPRTRPRHPLHGLTRRQQRRSSHRHPPNFGPPVVPA